MVDVVSDKPEMKIVRYFGGTTRGRYYDFVDPNTHKSITLTEKDILQAIALDGAADRVPINRDMADWTARRGS